MKHYTTVIVVAFLLTGCGSFSYTTPDEFRAHSEYTTSFVVDVEHPKIYIDTLKYLRPCWEHGGPGPSFRVISDIVGAASEISVGMYPSFSPPSILFVIDMKAAGTKTDVVVSGIKAKAKINDKIIADIKLIAAGKTTKCN